MSHSKKQKTHIFQNEKLVENSINVLECLIFDIKEKNRLKTKRENDQIISHILKEKMLIEKETQQLEKDLSQNSKTNSVKKIIKKQKKMNQNKGMMQKKIKRMADLVKTKNDLHNHFCKKIDLKCSFYLEKEKYISNLIKNFIKNNKSSRVNNNCIFDTLGKSIKNINIHSTNQKMNSFENIKEKELDDFERNLFYYVLCSSYLFFVFHGFKKCLLSSFINYENLKLFVEQNKSLTKWMSPSHIYKMINIEINLYKDPDIKIHTRKNLINFENNKNISMNKTVYQCPNCKNSLIMHFDKGYYLCSNQLCATIVPCSENISSNVSYERETCFNKGSVEKREHLKDRFNNVQTVDNKKIEEKMLYKVMVYLYDNLKITKPEQITRKHIKVALQKSKSKKYNQIEQIYQILTGEQQHSFFEIEKCVQHVSKMSENSFEDLKNNNQIERSNMPFYGNLMRAICKIMKFDEVIPRIQVLKGKDNNENTNKDIKKIIEESGIIV